MKQFAAFLFALTLLGCSPHDDKQNTSQQQASSSSSNYKENVSIVQSVEAKDGMAPNFVFYDETGKQVSFAEVAKGRPVLLNFWATWCGPCIKEMPDLVALNEEYKAKGALVIGISVDKDSDVLTLVSDFTKEQKVKYPIVIDNGDLETAFGGLRGIPTTFYIDKSGKIAKKLIGLQSKEKFASEFDALL
ncbi:MAG: TlpA family protein disulfide reductase [Ignavibacteriales bacterium]|nr:TlpA family protein disulfide reductase [Ignavibacteriales bacterium]